LKNGKEIPCTAIIEKSKYGFHPEDDGNFVIGRLSLSFCSESLIVCGIGNEEWGWCLTLTVARVQARRSAALDCVGSLAMQCVSVYNVAC
jgi:hypothetical protein